jgi:hypothetical protein
MGWVFECDARGSSPQPGAWLRSASCTAHNRSWPQTAVSPDAQRRNTPQTQIKHFFSVGLRRRRARHLPSGPFAPHAQDRPARSTILRKPRSLPASMPSAQTPVHERQHIGFSAPHLLGKAEARDRPRSVGRPTGSFSRPKGIPACMGLARGIKADVGALLARHGQAAHDHGQDVAQPHRRTGAPSQFEHARRDDRRIGTAQRHEEIDRQRAGNGLTGLAQIGVGRETSGPERRGAGRRVPAGAAPDDAAGRCPNTTRRA